MEDIGAVVFCQWCFAPLRGYAIDKSQQLRFRVVKQSNQEECSRRLLCCRPRLIRCAIGVIAVGPCMVVSDIGEFLHGLVQFLLCAKFIQVGTFIFQRVEIPLHGRIIIRIPCFAHTLAYMDRFAEFDESFCGILAPLVTVQDQIALCQVL